MVLSNARSLEGDDRVVMKAPVSAGAFIMPASMKKPSRRLAPPEGVAVPIEERRHGRDYLYRE